MLFNNYIFFPRDYCHYLPSQFHHAGENFPHLLLEEAMFKEIGDEST